jgi:hypothetical protein
MSTSSAVRHSPIATVNPYNNQLVREFPPMSREAVDNAAQRAQHAFQSWRPGRRRRTGRAGRPGRPAAARARRGTGPGSGPPRSCRTSFKEFANRKLVVTMPADTPVTDALG